MIPRDRQLLYSISQLMWDPVDPALYTSELADRSVLWQVALGDDQVPNLTSYTVARGADATLLTPSAHTPWGLASDAGPLEGPALSTFDPQMGNDDDTNRPASDSLSHETPRGWEGCMAQTLAFLDGEMPGLVAHFCGAEPCSVDATGGE